MKELIQSAHHLYKELELWQSMLDNAEMIHSLARKGKEFSSMDVLSASKQYHECRINALRVQESIDKVINQIKVTEL